MPIKPENRHRYPADWKAIRASILERAGHCCEGSPAYPDCRAKNGAIHDRTGSKVVLTIAHLDHVPENCDPSNLRAWCQLCHNTYDAPFRAANKKKRENPEKTFSKEIFDSIKALGPAKWEHSFDNVGQVVAGRAARRPADRQVVYRDRAFVLELKAVRGDTLPYSEIKNHQVRTLVRVARAGGFGLVLVKQLLARPRCWVIPSQLLVERELDIGVTGSFALGPPLVEVARIPDPRGWKGCVWDLKALLDGLVDGNVVRPHQKAGGHRFA